MSETAPTLPPVAIRHLSVTYPTESGNLHAVSDLSLEIAPGEIIGIVGESGSGKTTVAAALLGLLAPELAAGEAVVLGTDVLSASRRQLTELRRHHMAAILQDPLGSLNPVRRIRSQLIESATVAAEGRDVSTAISAVLGDVGLDGSKVLGRYPHELSGGMNQRVVIAMALLKNPQLLIADEPTSALDVRTQASIMRLLLKIRNERGASVLIITHDLELALSSCDRVAVMYAGRLVELGAAHEIRDAARHPYTRALLASAPRFGQRTQVRAIPGRFTAVMNDDPGCPFRSRCDRADNQCAETFPSRSMGATQYWCWNTETAPNENDRTSA